MWSHLGDGDVLHRAADDRGDLAFVVQVLAVGRSVQRAAVAVERADRLLEEGGRDEFRGLELDPPRLVVEMNAENLGRLARREVGRLFLGHRASVHQAQVRSVDRHPLRPSLVQDAAPLEAFAFQDVHVSCALLYRSAR